MKINTATQFLYPFPSSLFTRVTFIFSTQLFSQMLSETFAQFMNKDKKRNSCVLDCIFRLDWHIFNSFSQLPRIKQRSLSTYLSSVLNNSFIRLTSSMINCFVNLLTLSFCWRDLEISTNKMISFNLNESSIIMR